jgi:DNA-directed RNA polymerase subunit RPC12/RpoP
MNLYCGAPCAGSANYGITGLAVRKCPQCGGRLRRVHRSFWERFQYLAIYACKECRTEEYVTYPYRLHFGPHARCPKCGTHRLSKLREPDRIDPMHASPLNWFERLAGGRLFHCRYCRIQFYDRRQLFAEGPAAPPREHCETAHGHAGASDAQ